MNLLFVLLALMAQDARALDDALDAVAAVKPGDAESYLRARERVLALGADAIPLLRERGAAEKWTKDGWVRAMVAEACRVRLADPSFAAAVDRPRGLDPAVYRLFRKPEPMCAPELANRGPDGVPLLLERWRWTFSEVTGDAEREALRIAILHVPGHLADARARHLLEDALKDDSNRDAWREQAAVSLGLCGGGDALAPLLEVLDDERRPAPVRGACARALGRVPHAAALEAIRARLESPRRAELLTALGILGSSWAWNARGPAYAETANEIRKSCADLLVDALKTTPEHAEVIGRALAMTAWPRSVDAVEKMAQEGSEAAKSILPVLRRIRR